MLSFVAIIFHDSFVFAKLRVAKGLKASSLTLVYKRHLQSQFGSVIYRRNLDVFLYV